MRKLLLSCAILMIAASPAAAQMPKIEGVAAPPTDAKDAMEVMAKLAAPGPQHARFKKLEGKWNQDVTWTMDPSQPPQKSKSTSVIKSIMDGRYSQEQANGTMMGQSFSGMGITGYDNVIKKYVSIWIDNMGTGIMKSEGTASADGKTIDWTGETSDPMTGSVSKVRMVSTFTDDNHHTFDMYGQMPDGKEAKMMTIVYTRTKS